MLRRCPLLPLLLGLLTLVFTLIHILVDLFQIPVDGTCGEDLRAYTYFTIWTQNTNGSAANCWLPAIRFLAGMRSSMDDNNQQSEL
jgi:hypothetical protein